MLFTREWISSLDALTIIGMVGIGVDTTFVVLWHGTGLSVDTVEFLKLKLQRSTQKIEALGNLAHVERKLKTICKSMEMVVAKSANIQLWFIFTVRKHDVPEYFQVSHTHRAGHWWYRFFLHCVVSVFARHVRRKKAKQRQKKPD